MKKCTHENTQNGEMYGFTTAVYEQPYTHEERRAHGGVTYTETCQACGMQRKVNSNGRHYEYGAWHPGELGCPKYYATF